MHRRYISVNILKFSRQRANLEVWVKKKVRRNTHPIPPFTGGCVSFIFSSPSTLKQILDLGKQEISKDKSNLCITSYCEPKKDEDVQHTLRSRLSRQGSV